MSSPSRIEITGSEEHQWRKTAFAVMKYKVRQGNGTHTRVHAHTHTLQSGRTLTRSSIPSQKTAKLGFAYYTTKQRPTA